MTRKYTDEDLLMYAKVSTSISDLLRKLGLRQSGGSHAIVKQHLKRLGVDPMSISNQFGHSKTTIKSAIAKNTYRAEDIYCENSKYKNHGSIKNRVINDRAIDNTKCSICGILNTWNNKDLILRIDHINGINNDNRLENLRFVCPNCDSQLPTFCGRNINNGEITKININYICPTCGGKKSFTSENCRKCSSDHQRNNWPGKSELESMLEELGVCGVAKRLETSHTTIRRLIKKYGIDFETRKSPNRI